MGIMKTKMKILAVGFLLATAMMTVRASVSAWISGIMGTGYIFSIDFNRFGEAWIEAIIISPLVLILGIWLLCDLYNEMLSARDLQERPSNG